jgi:uncharacterized protein involved in outer membrane biogenesis
MRLAVKIVAVAGGLVVAAVVAVAIAIATIDVRTYVAPLQKRVKNATGRDLSFAGIDLKLSLVPTIVLTDVAFSNAAWAKAPHLVAAKRVEAQMALRPLLQRRVEIVRITVAEPVIALEAAGGKRNWTFEGSAAAPAPVPGAVAAGLMPSAFGVGEIAITGGTLTYTDGTAKATTIAIDSLVVNARDLQAPIDTRFRGNVDGIAVAVDGKIGPLDARLQQGPYPLQLVGEVAGRKASLRTRLGFVDGGYRLDDLDAAYGANEVKGEVAVLQGAARPRVTFRLTAAALAVAELPLPVSAPAASAPPVQASGTHAAARVFADDPVSFAFLRAMDADGDLAVDRLTLPNGRRLDKVRLRLALRDARLDVPSLQISTLGGSAQVALQIDGTREQRPTIRLKVDAKGLDLAALLDLAGVPRDVRGGETDVALDLALHGVSPRQWASGATGSVTANIGPATLANAKVAHDSPFNVLADLVNPFRGIDASTELQCGVIRLPLADGVARVERSIAMETKKVGVSASGTVDFRNETLDLTVKPRLREGVTIKVLQLASLVRVRGPFAAPTVGVDAGSSVTTAARIGAAFASGGLSILGETLLSGVTEKGAECDVARGAAKAQAR